MKSAEYWAQRAEAVMAEGMKPAEKLVSQLEKDYHKAQKNIEAEIRRLYENYARDKGMSYADAIQEISKSEYKNWRMDLGEYVERINATGDEELLRELDILSVRSRVTRLEQVQTAIKVEASELATKQTQKVTELLTKAYESSYYKSAYNIQTGLGFGESLAMLDKSAIADAVSYPWSGATFSERIWRDSEKLANTLRDTLTTGLIQGADVRQMTAAVQKAMNVSRSDAERLVRTETARVIEDAELLSYKDCGIEEYEILASLDSRTCKICGQQDGKRYKVEDAKTAVNYPPFHPRCRCTTVAYFPELEGDYGDTLRAARDGDGKYHLVAGNMTYEEWKEEMVFSYRSKNVHVSDSGDVSKAVQKRVIKSLKKAIDDIPQIRNLINGVSYEELPHGCIAQTTTGVFRTGKAEFSFRFSNELFQDTGRLVEVLRDDVASGYMFPCEDYSVFAVHEVGHAAHIAAAIQRVGGVGANGYLSAKKVSMLANAYFDIIDEAFDIAMGGETTVSAAARLAKELGSKVIRETEELIPQCFAQVKCGSTPSQIALDVVNYIKDILKGGY